MIDYCSKSKTVIGFFNFSSVLGVKTSSSEPPADTADLNERPSNTKATNEIFNNKLIRITPPNGS